MTIDRTSQHIEPPRRAGQALPYMHLRAYAGIGSRETPPEVLSLMRRLAARLGGMGFTLRSGGAGGADAAFDEGALSVGGLREIYIPWRGFSDTPGAILLDSVPGRERAYELAAKHHGGWPTMKDSVRKLMARNVCQVLGSNCKHPTSFVICYALRSKFDSEGRIRDVAGGTGQAVRVAYDVGVPVFNLAVAEHMDRLLAFYNRPAGAEGAAAVADQ